jgi:hypothetical protein
MPGQQVFWRAREIAMPGRIANEDRLHGRDPEDVRVLDSRTIGQTD